MPLQISSWNGLDTRFLPGMLQNNALLRAENAVIEHGQIKSLEKLKELGTFDAETFGLANYNGVLVTFGSKNAPALPPGVTYQQLRSPSQSPMTDVTCAVQFGKYMYVIAEYADGTVLHWYNNTIVDDWIVTNDVFQASMDLVWQYFKNKIEKKFPGFICYNAGNKMIVQGLVNQPFSISVSVVNNGSKINAASVATIQNATSSAPQRSEITFSGIFESQDVFSITINSIAFSTEGKALTVARQVVVCNGRLFAFVGNVLFFSGLEEPLQWDPLIDSTAGFIETANWQYGTSDIVNIAAFNDYLLVQNRTASMIWSVPADEEQFALVQTFPNMAAPVPVTQQQLNEQLMLVVTSAGIRAVSPKAALAGQFLSTTDGEQIDAIVADKLASAQSALSVYWPEKRRYYLFFDDAFGVVASLGDTLTWSTCNFGYDILVACRANNTLFMRDAQHKLLTFSSEEKAESIVQTVWFSSADTVGFEHLHAIAFGTWTVEYAIDEDINYWQRVGFLDTTVSKPTKKLTLGVRSNIIGLRFKGRGVLGSIVVD